MLLIQKENINQSIESTNLNLVYPNIDETGNNKKLIKLINKKIYEDIITFKEVISEDLKNQPYKLNIITEYQTSFNKNQIISISIEFSQIIGLNKITYINSYNYDLVLKKEILLSYIFKKSSNYRNEINKKISKKINEIISNDYEEISKYIDENSLIYTNQPFYITDDSIVVCFESYEISEYIPQPIEVEILFSECEEILSQYAINNIYKYKKNN